MTLQRRPVATGNDPDRLHVESSRLPRDDGCSANCQNGAAKIQARRERDGSTATCPNAASRIRQEGRPNFLVPERLDEQFGEAPQ